MVHCHYQRSFDLKIDFSDEARKYGLLGGRGNIGGHKAEMRIFEISALKGVKRGTDVKEGVNG